MKKIKYILIIMLSVCLLTGCKKDKMDDIKIITTTYPITHIIESIYKDNSTITSIYPNGISINEYEITDKQINEYAKADLFIYNGLDSNEKKIATRLLNKNKRIKLIDATQGLTIKSTYEELWLSPSNYLMIAQNIKEHLSDFITSTMLKETVNKKYENIKLTISKFDAQFKIIAENAKTKDVIVNNSSLIFLERYGFNVISIDPSENNYKTNLQKAKSNLSTKINNHVFAVDGKLFDENKSIGEVYNVRSMTILSLDDVKNKNSYESMMGEFIENLRTEAYT